MENRILLNKELPFGWIVLAGIILYLVVESSNVWGKVFLLCLLFLFFFLRFKKRRFYYRNERKVVIGGLFSNREIYLKEITTIINNRTYSIYGRGGVLIRFVGGEFSVFNLSEDEFVLFFDDLVEYYKSGTLNWDKSMKNFIPFRKSKFGEFI